MKNPFLDIKIIEDIEVSLKSAPEDNLTPTDCSDDLADIIPLPIDADSLEQ